MSDLKNETARLIESKIKQAILDETVKILNHKFQIRIKDMELYARIFYASILSSYSRARTFSYNVGMVLPQLEVITSALYEMSRTKKNKQGSFEVSKAFEVANTLRLKYRIPMTIKNNILTYKISFVINHPLLIALENGEVSWEGMPKQKIIKILQAALATIEVKKGKGEINRRSRRFSERIITETIADLGAGRFKLKKNKRPYLEIVVKNLIKEKDFIGILIN